MDGAARRNGEDGAEAAARVLERLRRIGELEERGDAGAVLGELRELVAEAEAWARLEGDARARAAVIDLDDALFGRREVEVVRLKTA